MATSSLRSPHPLLESAFPSQWRHPLIHQPLDVRLTEPTVELFQRGKREAAHGRSQKRGRFTTVEAHRPKAHQRYR